MSTIRMDEALLIRLYSEQPRSVDALPYTLEMDDLFTRYNLNRSSNRPPITRREAYIKLLSLRKGGKLIKKPKATTPRRV